METLSLIRSFDSFPRKRRFWDAIKAQGGSFLKLDDNGWTEADGKEARAKISHSFRSLRTILSKETGKSKTSATDNNTTHDESAPAVSLARPARTRNERNRDSCVGQASEILRAHANGTQGSSSKAGSEKWRTCMIKFLAWHRRDRGDS
jgi:hypothetical protein